MLSFHHRHEHHEDYKDYEGQLLGKGVSQSSREHWEASGKGNLIKRIPWQCAARFHHGHQHDHEHHDD